MAGPLRNLIQGIRSRRQRRRAAWDGGGDYMPSSPGMRGLINPLDSQEMSDRAQGVDISEAMPSTRLEASIPAGLTAQAQPAGSPARPSIQTTVAGTPSPAPAQGPFRQAQCPGGVCPTRPAPMQGGLDPRQYGITLAPGETLIGVGPQAGSSPQMAGAAVAASPAPASPATQAEPQEPAWMQSFNKMVSNPQGLEYASLAQVSLQQAQDLNRQANAAVNMYDKVSLRKQAFSLGQQAYRFMGLAAMQQDARANREYAQKAQEANAKMLRSGTLEGVLNEADELIRSRSEVASPDDVAAEIVMAQQQLTKAPVPARFDIQKDPTYQKHRRTGWNHRIAVRAAEENEATGNPFGTDEDRRSNASMSWGEVGQYYGKMPLNQALAEIDSTFKPSYARVLSERNNALPPEQRKPAADVNREAMYGVEMLKATLAYQQQPQQPAPPAPSPMRPASQSRPAAPIPPANDPRLWGVGSQPVF